MVQRGQVLVGARFVEIVLILKLAMLILIFRMLWSSNLLFKRRPVNTKFSRPRAIERPSPGPIGANYGLFWAIQSFVIFLISVILILVFLSFDRVRG